MSYPVTFRLAAHPSAAPHGLVRCVVRHHTGFCAVVVLVRPHAANIFGEPEACWERDKSKELLRRRRKAGCPLLRSATHHELAWISDSGGKKSAACLHARSPIASLKSELTVCSSGLHLSNDTNLRDSCSSQVGFCRLCGKFQIWDFEVV